MGKSQNDIVYDSGTLAYLRERVTRLSICSSQPGSYAAANSTTGVMLAQSGLLTSTDFILADGATHGRKATLAAQNGISVLKTGTMTHAAWLGSTGSQLLAVTTITSASLTSGGLVNAPAHYFEIGDVDAFSPSDISGLVGWWDFSDISTLYQDSSKTTPVASDADPIGAVEDKSGNGNDMLQATTALKPTYKTAIQNGLSIGRGDGGDAMLTAGNVQVANVSTGEWTAAAVADVTGGSGFPGVVGSDDSTTSSVRVAQFIRFAISSGVMQSIAFDESENPFTDASGSYASGFNTMIALRGTSAIEAYVNGASNGSTPTTGTPDKEANEVALFTYDANHSNGILDQLTGDIGEVVLYNRELTSGERSQLETYLNNKWAVY